MGQPMKTQNVMNAIPLLLIEALKISQEASSPNRWDCPSRASVLRPRVPMGQHSSE